MLYPPVAVTVLQDLGKIGRSDFIGPKHTLFFAKIIISVRNMLVKKSPVSVSKLYAYNTRASTTVLFGFVAFSTVHTL